MNRSWQLRAKKVARHPALACCVGVSSLSSADARPGALDCRNRSLSASQPVAQQHNPAQQRTAAWL